MDINGPMGLRDQLNLSYVPRWTIVPMLRSQSVAEHTYRVAVIARDLGLRLNVPGTGNLAAVSALYHDTEESVTGDIPSTAKPPTPWPDTQVGVLVKLADMLESMWWVRMWGHGPRIDTIFTRLSSMVESLTLYAAGTELFNEIDLRSAIDGVVEQMEWHQS